MLSRDDLALLSRIHGADQLARLLEHPEILDADLAAVNALQSNARGFKLVSDGLPPNDRPVLALRRSGYTSATFEILTARYMPAYRPLSPWRDLSLDSVHDSGEPVLAWREAPELFA